MSETLKNPFTMVGSEDAAVCVDGVCEVSPVQEPAADAARDVQVAAVAAGARAATMTPTEVDTQS